MNEWVELKRGNDWGSEYISFEPLKGGFASTSRALQVEPGEFVDLMAKDGTELRLAIKFESDSAQVSDHGHSYSVSYSLPGVIVDVLGEPTWMPLDKFKVRRGWAESRQP